MYILCKSCVVPIFVWEVAIGMLSSNQFWRLQDLARLILFNKRRGEEPAKLKIASFLNRPSWKDGNDEIVQSFNPIERELMKKYVNMSWFCHFRIDATVVESNSMGRLINDDPHSNCAPELYVVEGQPRIVFLAQRPIEAGEELRYDYNCDPGSMPWRNKQVYMCVTIYMFSYNS